MRQAGLQRKASKPKREGSDQQVAEGEKREARCGVREGTGRGARPAEARATKSTERHRPAFALGGWRERVAAHVRHELNQAACPATDACPAAAQEQTHEDACARGLSAIVSR